MFRDGFNFSGIILILIHRPLECSICLETFKPGDRVKILPCNHIFHESCASSWIVDVRGVCPLCRRGIFPTVEDVRMQVSELKDRTLKKNE